MDWSIQMKICPRCGHKNCGEDKFCENCLMIFVEVNPSEENARWM